MPKWQDLSIKFDILKIIKKYHKNICQNGYNSLLSLTRIVITTRQSCYQLERLFSRGKENDYF